MGFDSAEYGNDVTPSSDSSKIRLKPSGRRPLPPVLALSLMALGAIAQADEPASMEGAGLLIAPELATRVSEQQGTTFRLWAEAWSGVLREHERLTGEGIQIHLGVRAEGETGGLSVNAARSRWSAWTQGSDSKPTQRCVGVAEWHREEDGAFESTPTWDFFCGLTIDTALSEGPRTSPFSTQFGRLRRRLLEDSPDHEPTSAQESLTTLPSGLLEASDLLSARLLLLLAHLQSPVPLESQALHDRWTSASADPARLWLWQELRTAIQSAASESLRIGGPIGSLIGGDETPPLDIPVSRWALLFTTGGFAPLLILLACWIFARESYWSRYGRKKTPALKWLTQWLTVIRLRTQQRSQAVSTEVVRGNW